MAALQPVLAPTVAALPHGAPATVAVVGEVHVLERDVARTDEAGTPVGDVLDGAAAAGGGADAGHGQATAGAVVFSTMPLALLLAQMLWKVKPWAPMVVFATLSAVPVVLVMVLPAPVHIDRRAPPLALKPVPLVVLITNPPPEKIIVAPVFVARVMAALAPVVQTFDVPVKLIVGVPVLLFCTSRPVAPAPLAARFPESATLPPVFPVILD